MASDQTERTPDRGSLRRQMGRGLVLSMPGTGFAVGATTLAGPASAHCPDPGNNGHRYVAGGSSAVEAKSARVRAGWMTPSQQNVCNSGSSYSVSITRGLGTSNPGWIQAGWRYYRHYARPMGYCERSPRSGGTGVYAVSEYRVAQEAQLYNLVKDTAAARFECRIGGVVRQSFHQDVVGFANGDWMPVQAEAHARHVQLGTMSPFWFGFAKAKRQRVGGATPWEDMNLGTVRRDDTIYNSAQPAPDGFFVNTDAH